MNQSRYEMLTWVGNASSATSFAFRRMSIDVSASHTLSSKMTGFYTTHLVALGSTSSFGGQVLGSAPIVMSLFETYSGCDSASPSLSFISETHNLRLAITETLIDEGSVPVDNPIQLVLTELPDFVGARLDGYGASVYADASCQADYEFADQDFSELYFYANSGDQALPMDLSQTVCGSGFTFSIDAVELVDEGSNDMLALDWITFSSSEITIETDDPSLTEGDWVLTGTAFDTSSAGTSISIGFSFSMSVENGNYAPVLDSEDCDGLVVD